MRTLLLLACSATMIAACSDKNEAAEDKLERAAQTSAKVAGALPAALGLTEAQLLDADLVGADGQDMGDVEQVLRDADNRVDRLLVELDGIGPDHYVHVPITGLKTVVKGDDTDLVTPMTKADLVALPEVKLPAP
ncbi:MAG TPA: PRC-barrel domain containing protein [Sphingopyxis sp.]|uniref:PRC-barrel domain containing protein n=1 Tax=Sphingopyxis sp. TaxID=1908224 RepID=UPI002CB2D523|nr:PRC-barrel domain containing protein [Sphingopyxis sp.]HWW56034.1 PRC-barrel domain containing protein [Sphingopyxis sp.]